MPAHLTLFHHLPPSLEAELSHRLAAYTAVPPPKTTLSAIINLGSGEELEDISYDLAEAVRGMLTPQDQAPWRPHVTIQNKVEPKEAKRLQAELRARFEPRPLSIRGLASWRYLGGPWEPIKTHVFRG